MKRFFAAVVAAIFSMTPGLGFAAPGFFTTPKQPAMADYVPSPAAERPMLPALHKAGNGHSLYFVHDQFKRLATIFSSHGNRYDLIYATIFDKNPKHVLVNGKERSLPLWGGSREKYMTVDDPDFPMMRDTFGQYMGGYPGCPMCVSVDDSVADLGSFVVYGGGLGGLLGAVAGFFYATTAIGVFIAIGVGTFIGFGAAIIIAGVWIVGHMIVDHQNKIVYWFPS